MKKTKILIILILIIVLSGCVSKNELESVRQNTVIEQNTTVEQYSDWQFYRNEKLGFEIKYPLTVSDTDCELIDEKYKAKDSPTPVKIFGKDNVVYISTEYYYNPDGYNNDYRLYSKCEKIDKTLEILEQAISSDYDLRFWKIIVKDDIYTDQDINKFLKDFYSAFGGNCVLGEKQPTSQAGVYNIFTYYNDKDLSGSECFINGRSVVKYYPEGHKIVAWLVGQETVFWQDGKDFDEAMIESFRFID